MPIGLVTSAEARVPARRPPLTHAHETPFRVRDLFFEQNRNKRRGERAALSRHPNLNIERRKPRHV